jgi:thioredoxin reductase (NADPH)
VAKPALLCVDDDPEVLQAVQRDLRKQYADRYRVLRASSGEEALDALEQLKLRNDPVALLLSDQRMPGMDGVAFLRRAIEVFPAAKRVLLTAYADTEAAIAAINQVRLDYYILKPWDPPEETLYPILDDLLEDWQASYRPPFEGVRVVGHRWSADSFRVRDFLARNQVPYRWIDVETDAAEAEPLLSAAQTDQLPLVLLPDGQQLADPGSEALATSLGIRRVLDADYFDLVIVGGGPSGLAAAVYGASEGLSTALVERDAPGGQAGQSSRIENYLGFPSGLSGADLTRRAVSQARRFGVQIVSPAEVVSVRLADPYRVVRLADGGELNCQALVVSTGVSYMRLDAPGVDRLTGRGVYYGAARSETIDCQGEEVYVVGAANSAGQAAMYLSQEALRVHILVRGDALRKSMSSYLADRIEQTPNIVVQTCTEVAEAHGDDHLEEITLRNSQTGEQRRCKTSSLFIFIGAQPYTDWLDGVVQRDRRGFLLTGPDVLRQRPGSWAQDREPYLLETSVPGIFAVGDVRATSVKRVASAVGEGSVAVSMIHQYLAGR